MENMLTFEDVTDHFLKASVNVGLATHPEFWTNARTLEREFACTCHTGACEDAEQRGSCTVSFTWSSLDTALSLEGPEGVCDFFHEPGEDCPHLHTRDIPPLEVDLSYNLTLNGVEMNIPEDALLSLTQMLKLQASEHSSRAVETRPGVSMILADNRLQPEALTLQQRVEIPIWHPEGMRGLREYQEQREHSERDRERGWRRRGRELSSYDEDDDANEEHEVIADAPHPEEWLPQVMVEICQDVVQVLSALDGVRSHGLLS
jgi:hypothetical protein